MFGVCGLGMGCQDYLGSRVSGLGFRIEGFKVHVPCVNGERRRDCGVGFRVRVCVREFGVWVWVRGLDVYPEYYLSHGGATAVDVGGRP